MNRCRACSKIIEVWLLNQKKSDGTPEDMCFECLSSVFNSVLDLEIKDDDTIMKFDEISDSDIDNMLKDLENDRN